MHIHIYEGQPFLICRFIHSRSKHGFIYVQNCFMWQETDFGPGRRYTRLQSLGL